MKSFNHQAPAPTSAWSDVGRTEVMAMTDIYRLTHPHTIISRHIYCKSSLGGSTVATCKVNSSHQQQLGINNNIS